MGDTGLDSTPESRITSPGRQIYVISCVLLTKLVDERLLVWNKQLHGSRISRRTVKVAPVTVGWSTIQTALRAILSVADLDLPLDQALRQLAVLQDVG